MKALVLTSDGMRHDYFARVIAKNFETPFVVVQKKKDYYDNQQKLSEPVARHLAQLRLVEQKWFCAEKSGTGPDKKEVSDINSPDVVAWAKKQKFGVVCLFGTSILKDGWLSSFNEKIINLHLGLSPFYRGSATLFWPFVNRELHLLGTTIHLASAKVDAGDILERVDAKFVSGEDYYGITSRLIRNSIDRFPTVAKEYLTGERAPNRQEPIKGKYYRKADFNEKSLLSALEYVQRGLAPSEIERIEYLRACRY